MYETDIEYLDRELDETKKIWLAATLLWLFMLILFYVGYGCCIESAVYAATLVTLGVVRHASHQKQRQI
jgi:hypothetical protein